MTPFSAPSEDAWGQRRNPITWSGPPTSTDDGGADSLTPRGFTGHEMLDDLGLVHMNGRIYDGVLGRFLSADLFVQDPSDLQCFNRFSYVKNRPLSLLDPSGFKSEDDLTDAEYYEMIYNRVHDSDYRAAVFSGARVPTEEEWTMDPSLLGLRGSGLIVDGINDVGDGAEFVMRNAPGFSETTATLELVTGTNIRTGEPTSRAEAALNLGMSVGGEKAAGVVVKKLSTVVSGGTTKVLNAVEKDAPVQSLVSDIESTVSKTSGDIPSSKELKKNLAAAGRPVEDGEAAHHIVAGADPRAAPARARLEADGIPINSADNGVGLPQNKTSPNPSSKAVHSTVHTNANYDKVNEAVVNAPDGAVPDVLEDLRGQLNSGGLK